MGETSSPPGTGEARRRPRWRRRLKRLLIFTLVAAVLAGGLLTWLWYHRTEVVNGVLARRLSP
jgi:hypothetical protein